MPQKLAPHARAQRVTAFVKPEIAQALAARARDEHRSISFIAAELLRSALTTSETGLEAGFAKTTSIHGARHDAS
jgi:hypothetical protein